MEYPLKIANDGGFLRGSEQWEVHCNEDRLKEYLMQQNFIDKDVSKLMSFITRRPFYTTPTSISFQMMKLVMEEYAVNGVKLQAVFCIDPNKIYRNHYILRMLLRCLCSEDRVRLLQIPVHLSFYPRRLGFTLLHLIVSNGATKALETALESVQQDLHERLLRVYDVCKQTPLHKACGYGSRSIALIRVITGLTSDQTRYKLLMVQDQKGDTPLHIAAAYGPAQMIRIIAESLKDDQFIYLLLTTNYEENTPLQLAELRGSDAAAQLLQKYQTDIRLEMVQHITDVSVRQQMIGRIAEQEPLTVSQVQQLSPYSDRYIIPQNQKNLKMCAVILYNTYDSVYDSPNRYSGESEANYLAAALTAAGFMEIVELQCAKHQDFDKVIERELDAEFFNHCSLLMVCMLSDDHRGSQEAVENIQLNAGLSKEMPLTCQVPRQTESPGQKDPNLAKSVLLSRHHSALLHCSMKTCIATTEEGSIISAMADELSSTDGTRDMATIFERLVVALKRDRSYQREDDVMMFYCTLAKHLILPSTASSKHALCKRRKHIIYTEYTNQKTDCMVENCETASCEVELGGCHSTSEKQVHESTDNIDGIDSMIHKNSLSAHAAHGQDMLAEVDMESGGAAEPCEDTGLSTDVCMEKKIESLYDQHVRALQALAHLTKDGENLAQLDKSPESNRSNQRCLTCTVVSVAETNSQPGPTAEHVALLSNGHSPMVSNYQNTVGSLEWRVGTIHTKSNAGLVDFCEQMSNDCSAQTAVSDKEPHCFLAKIIMPERNEDSGSLSPIKMFSGASSYQHLPNLVIQITHEPWMVKFQLKTDADRDAVSGLLNVDDGYGCNNFHNSDASESSDTNGVSSTEGSCSSDDEPCQQVVLRYPGNINSDEQESDPATKYASYIKTLHKPGDTRIVTVKLMWRTSMDSGVHCLFHWLAGVVEMHEGGDEAKTWGSSVYHLRNDNIFESIISGFEGLELDESKRKKFSLNCTEFIVTADEDLQSNTLGNPIHVHILSNNNNNHNHHNNNNTDNTNNHNNTTNTNNHNNNTQNTGACERQIYTFAHPADEDLFVKILEPASPADAEYHATGQELPVMKEKVTLEPLRIRQRRLENEQIRIFKYLRLLDESGSPAKDDPFLTAIVSTAIDNKSMSGLKSTVFLTHGFSIDNGLGRLDVRACPGWMTTTRFLRNSDIVRAISKVWKATADASTSNTEFFRGQPKFACICIESLEKFKVVVPDPSKISPKGENMVYSSHGTLSFTPQTEQFSFQPSLMSEGQEAQKYQVISSQQATSHSDLCWNKINEDVRKALLGVHGGGDGCRESPLTICKITAETFLKQEKRKKKKTKVGIRKKAEKTELALCIAGQHPEVELPKSMPQYIDPLTKLTYCKEVVFDKKLTEKVKGFWRNAHAGFDMERFVVVDLENSSNSFENVWPSKYPPFTVRLKRDLVELWCHGSRINSVHAMLEENGSGIEKLKKVMKEGSSADRENLKQKFLREVIGDQILPKSFHSPTMGIMFPGLPIPNHLGIMNSVGDLMHDKQDGVHLKVAKKGSPARKEFGCDDVEKLVEFHIQQESKHKKKHQEQEQKLAEKRQEQSGKQSGRHNNGQASRRFGSQKHSKSGGAGKHSGY